MLADIRSGVKVHPLQHPLLPRMTAVYPAPGTVQPKTLHEWQYFENIVAPTKMLMQLGIGVFTDALWTSEVIQTIFWRLENNANQATTSLVPGQELVHMVNLNTNYLIFNHSCQPNLSWYVTVGDGDCNVDSLRDEKGDVLRPGCNTVWCNAARDIKKDE